MNKQDFLEKLRQGLAGLPQEDIEERVLFYREMIEDRMEEGCPEEEAVSRVGEVEEIIPQIIADIPITRIVRARMAPRKKMKAWEIVLLAVGSPIWLALGISALAVICSLYLALWSVLISFWSVFASLAAGGLAGFMVGAVLTVGGTFQTGVALIGAGLVLAGLSVFTFIGCRAATKGTLFLTKKIALWIKNLFIKKEVVG